MMLTPHGAEEDDDGVADPADTEVATTSANTIARIAFIEDIIVIFMS
jgi:hypothetical protein